MPSLLRARILTARFARIASEGQITIPRDVRQDLGLRTVDTVAIAVHGNHATLTLGAPDHPCDALAGGRLLSFDRGRYRAAFEGSSCCPEERAAEACCWREATWWIDERARHLHRSLRRIPPSPLSASDR